MLGILFRNICSRPTGNTGFAALLVIWFAAGISDMGSYIDVEAFINSGVQMVMIIFIGVLSGGIQLPHTMFMLPFSRQDRKDYIKKLRNTVFLTTLLVCAAVGIFLVICVGSTILCAACTCITGVSMVYVLSYADYFMAKDSGMMGILVLFCLLHMGIMGGTSFYNKYDMGTQGIWILAACICLAFIETVVLHRYTDNMINRLSDYESSVNMEKKLRGRL